MYYPGFVSLILPFDLSHLSSLLAEILFVFSSSQKSGFSRLRYPRHQPTLGCIARNTGQMKKEIDISNQLVNIGVLHGKFRVQAGGGEKLDICLLHSSYLHQISVIF